MNCFLLDIRKGNLPLEASSAAYKSSPTIRSFSSCANIIGINAGSLFVDQTFTFIGGGRQSDREIMCLFLLFLMMGKKPSKSKTRVKNLTDWPVDIQIRVGSILKKAYTLKPGCSKTLRRNKIYNSYSNNGEGSFFYAGCCEPYVWIHNPSHAAKYFISPMAAKQQYISLNDLRECLEMKICMDGANGNFSVLKMPRSC